MWYTGCALSVSVLKYELTCKSRLNYTRRIRDVSYAVFNMLSKQKQ